MAYTSTPGGGAAGLIPGCGAVSRAASAFAANAPPRDHASKLFAGDDPDSPVTRLCLWAREKLSPDDLSAFETMLENALNEMVDGRPEPAPVARGVDRRRAADSATSMAMDIARRRAAPAADASLRRTYGVNADHAADVERRLGFKLPRAV